MPGSAGGGPHELLDGAHPHQRRGRVSRGALDVCWRRAAVAEQAMPRGRGLGRSSCAGLGCRAGRRGLGLISPPGGVRMRPRQALRRPPRSVDRARSPTSPARSRARLTPFGPLRRSRPGRRGGAGRCRAGARTVRISHMRNRRVKKSHMTEGRALNGRCSGRRRAGRPSSRCCRRAGGRGTPAPRRPAPRATVSRTTSSTRAQPAPSRPRDELRPCRSAWSLTMKPRRLSFLVTSMNMLRGPGCGSTAL